MIGLKIRQAVSISVLIWKSKTYQSIKKQIMEHLYWNHYGTVIMVPHPGDSGKFKKTIAYRINFQTVYIKSSEY